MHAIILVGGRGTRLQPLTDTRPKPMLPIVDRPFLEHQLLHLKRHGVTAVTFACGYLPSAIIEHFGDGRDIGVDLTFVLEPEPLDTAGAIAFAARTIEPQRLLVCNGDVLTDLDITRLVAVHNERGAVGTIALTPVDDPTRYGLVRTDEDGAVLAFLEKPTLEEAGDDRYINAGTYVLEPAIIDSIPDQGRCNIERETFPAFVGKGLYAIGFDGYWNDIGTLPSYLQANLDQLAGRINDPHVGGGSWIAPDARVDADATVACSVVSHGAKVGAGARVLNSVVLEHATVEAGAQLDGVVVGEGATVAGDVQLDTGDVVAPVAG